jgi:hypothetical protein
MNTKIELKKHKIFTVPPAGEAKHLIGVQYVVQDGIVFVKLIEACVHYGRIVNKQHPSNISKYFKEIKKSGKKYLEIKNTQGNKPSMYIQVEDCVYFLNWYKPRNPNIKFKKRF